MAKLTKDYFERENGREETRINKYLSDAGMCSRREADRLIAQGRVLIDGAPAAMGSKVMQGQKVTIAGREIKKDDHMVLIAFNKPQGIVCTTDRREPDNIIDFINYGSRIFPIGRLDKESEGLILLTNDGEIVNKILRAGNRHEKEYLVQVNKPLTEEFLRGMAGGVPILDTVTRPCLVEQLDKTTFRIVLTQGLNRQIRRMCEYFNYRVRSLKRVRIMNVSLGRLKTGTYRNLTQWELEELNRLLRESSNQPFDAAAAGEEQLLKEGVVLLKKDAGKPAPKRSFDTPKPENRGQKPERRGEKPESRSQKPEKRGRKPEAAARAKNSVKGEGWTKKKQAETRAPHGHKPALKKRFKA